MYLVATCRYLGERKQFGAPLAAFQLNQEKLVRMLGNIQAMSLLGWRLCKLHDAGQVTVGQASMGKVISLHSPATSFLNESIRTVVDIQMNAIVNTKRRQFG